MATQLLYGNQYYTTTLNVGGGINDSQTAGIILTDVSGLDTTKPGIALINYSDPLNTSIAEWVEYTSINGSKELVGAIRGSEGFSAKSHNNGVTIAFPLSESHINRLATALSIGGSASNGVEGVLDEDDMASNSNTKIPTQQSTKAYVDTQISTVGSTTGWNSISDTLTYASSTTFTISSVDRTTTYTPGTRIKLTQTTAKYFVVVSSSFSTNTTVTITGGSDYTLANAAITSPYYSYQVNPQGYPSWFAYTPTYAGFSANPTTASSRFCVVGRKCLVQHNESAAGTSNATTMTISLPITAATQSGANWSGSTQCRDNGTVQTNSGLMRVQSAATVVDCHKDWFGNNWTNTGNKQVIWGQIEYEI